MDARVETGAPGRPDTAGSPARVADAIVVLGCRVLPSGRPTEAARRRAQAGAEAFHRGLAPRVVVSGGRRWGRQIEARVLGRLLVSMGVPESAVFEELCSLSTRENALCVARCLRARGERRVCVVTCPWHMTRALANFDRAGLQPIAVPARTPAAGPLTRVRRAVHEQVSSWLDGMAARRGRAAPGAPS